MAVATLTSSNWEKLPAKAPHIGNTTVGPYKFQWTQAGTIGDIGLLCKVPDGARITDFQEYHSNGQTAAALSFGFDRGVASGGAGNASCLVASGALATHNRMSFAAFPAGWLGTISLSEADPLPYASLIVKAESGTFTNSVSLTWSLTYSMDGQ